jgi:hypothetical protein
MPPIGFAFLRPTIADVAALALGTSLTVAPACADSENVVAQLYFSRLKTESPRAFCSGQTARCGSVLSRLAYSP